MLSFDFAVRVVGWVFGRRSPKKSWTKGRPPRVRTYSNNSIWQCCHNFKLIGVKSLDVIGPDLKSLTIDKMGSAELFQSLVVNYSYQVGKCFSLVFPPSKYGDLHEELTQDVIFRLYKSLGNYSQKTPFSVWVYTFVKNRILQEIRRMRRCRETCVSQSNLGLEGLESIARQIDSHEFSLIADEVASFVAESIEDLTQYEREVVSLYLFEDMDPNQITGMLGKNAGKSLSRIKNKLKPKFQRYFLENFSENVELAQ